MSVFSYLPLVPAGVLIWQDFQKRSVQAGWLMLFGAFILLETLLDYGWQQTLSHVLFNGLLLGFLCVGLCLYLHVRYGKGKHLWRGWLGSGDGWMLIALVPAFGLREYVWFLTITLLATLIVYTAYRHLFAGRRATIPLVSALGMTYIGYTLARYLCLT